jgi:hypothetical protein
LGNALLRPYFLTKPKKIRKGDFRIFHCLQFALQEVGHLRVQVPGGISTRNPMVAVGVVEGFKLLVSRNECVD